MPEEQQQANSTGTEQAKTGIQAIVEQSKGQQAQSAQTAQSAATATQQTDTKETAQQYTPEQIALWQAQAAEAEKYKKQYEALQPEYTRSRQQLAQILGVQQQAPQDPYAPFVEMAKQKGFDEDSARAVAEMADQIAQRRTEGAMQAFQFQNAGNQIPLVLNQAYGMVPQALANPKVQEALRDELNQLAQAGHFGYLNPEYAANRAKIIAFDQGFFSPGKQETVVPPQNPNMAPMWGIPNGYSGTPPQQQQKTDAPKTQEVINDLKARYPNAKIQ